MKKDFFDNQPPEFEEDFWEDDLGYGRRPPRRKKDGGRNTLLIKILIGVLLGAVLGIISQFALYGSALEDLWSWFQSGETGSYDAGDDFGYDYSGDVEVNDEASQEYSLPLYDGDSSGLTIQLNPSSGTALTAAELYQQELPATVSITVYAGRSAAYGSGMILTSDGYVLTCAHVIENTESAVVTTSDGTEYDAELVGSDVQTDLAVLKIDAQGLTPVTFTSSDDLVVGEQVYAIGDPLGPQFRGSLTDGLISGLNRQVSSNGYSMTLIQTTAAVNSGNSGCPLFNDRGQVIGVVNMKMSSSGSTASIDNMGLAVPSAIVKKIVETLATEGKVTRAVLGISCYAIDETASRTSGLPQGLWVSAINEPSQCDEAGLLIGDIITEVNGEPVNSVNRFQLVTEGYAVGDTVTLTVYRDEWLAEQALAALEEDAAGKENIEDSSVAEGESWESPSTEEVEYNFVYFGELTVELVDSGAVED